MTAAVEPAAPRIPRVFGLVLPPGMSGRGPLRMVERNALAYRRVWYVFASGLAEPFLYLLSIGVGVGALVGKVPGPGGRLIEYREFVAPAMLSVAAMNGAVVDTTFGVFWKIKYARIYDAVLATPLAPGDVALGEITWALLRGSFYAAAFLLAMVGFGLVHSVWALLVVPVAVLIGFAFAGAGFAATTFMRSFVDFDYVSLVLTPLFLFSATFFPLSRYPEGLQWVVRVTPLYQGVALERALVLGDVHWGLLLHVGYLAAMGLTGLHIATRRLGLLLQP